MEPKNLYKVDVNPDSNNLLRIIHTGIDNIILKLKIEVDKKGENGEYGTTIKTNDAVVKILKVFSDFQDGKIIDEDQVMKEREIGVNKEPIQTENVLKPNNFGSSKAAVVLNTGILKQKLAKSQTDLPADTIEADILDLRTGINYINDYVNNEHKITITNENQAQLTQRLNNCRYLEYLYLKKHDEIIRIFGFVVDLFDKYKYAIKVILFLLKNLVRAENIPGQNIPGQNRPGQNIQGSVGVRLPKPIITGINLLLKDQANIQTIIDGMEKVVGETDTAIQKTDEPKIKESLEAQGSTPAVVPQPSP